MTRWDDSPPRPVVSWRRAAVWTFLGAVCWAFLAAAVLALHDVPPAPEGPSPASDGDVGAAVEPLAPHPEPPAAPTTSTDPGSPVSGSSHLAEATKTGSPAPDRQLVNGVEVPTTHPDGRPCTMTDPCEFGECTDLPGGHQACWALLTPPQCWIPTDDGPVPCGEIPTHTEPGQPCTLATPCMVAECVERDDGTVECLSVIDTVPCVVTDGVDLVPCDESDVARGRTGPDFPISERDDPPARVPTTDDELPVSDAHAPYLALADCESGDRLDGVPVPHTARWWWGDPAVEHPPWGTMLHEGGLQFAPSTWQWVAGDLGLLDRFPHAWMAPPLMQIEVAVEVQARQGWGAWPNCSRIVGLR